MTMPYGPMRLGRKATPDGAAMGGDQVLFNGVPIRPVSAVGNFITFDVANPFRVSLGVIPKGAGVIGALVAVMTAFNAGTTNVLVVGTYADIDQLVEAGDVNEAAVGTILVCHRGGLVLTEDTEYFIQFTQTGAAATAGRAGVALLYAIP
jgi:hypothetical protein